MQQHFAGDVGTFTFFRHHVSSNIPKLLKLVNFFTVIRKTKRELRNGFLKDCSIRLKVTHAILSIPVSVKLLQSLDLIVIFFIFVSCKMLESVQRGNKWNVLCTVYR